MARDGGYQVRHGFLYPNFLHLCCTCTIDLVTWRLGWTVGPILAMKKIIKQKLHHDCSDAHTSFGFCFHPHTERANERSSPFTHSLAQRSLRVNQSCRLRAVSSPHCYFSTISFFKPVFCCGIWIYRYFCCRSSTVRVGISFLKIWILAVHS